MIALILYACLYILGISRDSWHKRRNTGGKKTAIRKKRKYELGRPPANTKVGRKMKRLFFFFFVCVGFLFSGMIADYILRVDSFATYMFSCHICLLEFVIAPRLRLSKLTCFQRPMIIKVS